jgi:predicted HTH domain antitoxin
MPTVSVRLDNQIIKDIEFLMRDYKADRSEVIRRLLDRGLRQAKIEKVLELLRQHKISIGKAAKFADVTLYEMIDLCKKHEIHIGYTKDDLRRDLERFKI